MSQILKVVESRNEVQAILYTNLRINEGTTWRSSGRSGPSRCLSLGI